MPDRWLKLFGDLRRGRSRSRTKTNDLLPESRVANVASGRREVASLVGVVSPINHLPELPYGRFGRGIARVAQNDGNVLGNLKMTVVSPTGPDRLQTAIDRWFPADQPRRAA